MNPVWAVSTFVPDRIASSASKVRGPSVAPDDVEAGADEVDVDVEETRVEVDVVDGAAEVDVVVYLAGQYGAALAPAVKATMTQRRLLRVRPIVNVYQSGVPRVKPGSLPLSPDDLGDGKGPLPFK